MHVKDSTRYAKPLEIFPTRGTVRSTEKEYSNNTLPVGLATFDINDISVYSEDNHDKDNEREQQQREFVLHFLECLILRKLGEIFNC